MQRCASASLALRSGMRCSFYSQQRLVTPPGSTTTTAIAASAAVATIATATTTTTTTTTFLPSTAAAFFATTTTTPTTLQTAAAAAATITDKSSSTRHHVFHRGASSATLGMEERGAGHSGSLLSSFSTTLMAVVGGGCAAAAAAAAAAVVVVVAECEPVEPTSSSSSLTTTSTTTTPLAEKAEALYKNGAGDPNAVYDLLTSADAISRGRHYAQEEWRLGRACHRLAEANPDKAEKEASVREGLRHATLALELDESNFACHKWYAILLSDVGEFNSTTDQIKNAYVIKEHFERAIELNPDDPTSHHLLGIWCITFANMPWYQRKAAAAFFSTPPSSTYEEALKCFETAEKLSPGFYPKNRLYLAKVHYAIGNTMEARNWCNGCLELPAVNPDDRAAHKEARDLLKVLY